LSIDVEILRKIKLEKNFQGQIFENLVGGTELPGATQILRRGRGDR